MSLHWDNICTGIVVIGMIATGTACFQYRVESALKRDGVRIKARVEKIELRQSSGKGASGPNFYWELTYRYETPDGKSRKNFEQLWDSNLAKSLHTDDLIDTAYSRNKPQVSSAVANFDTEINLNHMMCFGIPAVVVFLLLLNVF